MAVGTPCSGGSSCPLLKALSAEGGHTVILITHDTEIAAQAARVIRMQDGRLLAGETDKSGQEAAL